MLFYHLFTAAVSGQYSYGKDQGQPWYPPNQNNLGLYGSIWRGLSSLSFIQHIELLCITGYQQTDTGSATNDQPYTTGQLYWIVELYEVFNMCHRLMVGSLAS